MKFKFLKSERLKSKKLIEETYAKGFSSFAYPFKTKFKDIDTQNFSDPKILISIPKKKIKHAVERNRIKRLTLEAYRTSNHEFKQFLMNKHLSIVIEFIYVGDKNIMITDISKSLYKHYSSISKHYE